MIIVTSCMPAGNRMTIAVTTALALHALVIAGVRFQPLPPRQPESPPMRVALQTNANRVAPTDPAPEAAASNLGGGEANETPEMVSETQQREGMAIVKTETEEDESSSEEIEPPVDSTTEDPPETAESPVDDSTASSQPKRRLSATSLMRQARQIAMSSSGGRTAQFRQTQEKPDGHGSDAKYSVREAYIQAWVSKVQEWGNRNFPDAARRDELTGTLTLSVTLRADGTVANMHLLRASGHEVLDQAAQRIVTLAAPYSPFPESLRKEYGDSLTIKRTWQFLRGSRLASG